MSTLSVAPLKGYLFFVPLQQPSLTSLDFFFFFLLFLPLRSGYTLSIHATRAPTHSEMSDDERDELERSDGEGGGGGRRESGDLQYGNEKGKGEGSQAR